MRHVDREFASPVKVYSQRELGTARKGCPWAQLSRYCHIGMASIGKCQCAMGFSSDTQAGGNALGYRGVGPDCTLDRPKAPSGTRAVVGARLTFGRLHDDR